MKNMYYKFCAIFFVLLMIFSCEQNETVISDNSNLSISGTGVINFTSYDPLENNPIDIFYYVPAYTRSTTPIVFIFHGNGRNAKDYRDAAVAKAKEFGFIVIAPEFSREYFPSGDQYNLGNVFVDGDNPSSATLNSEEVWTFSIVEPIFEYFKKELKNTSSKYHIIGHSAGSQFAHRLLQFKENLNVDKAVLSAAGWYTVTNNTVDFPYGVAKTPIENSNFETFFKYDIIVQVGELDNDPNAASLRKNSIVDQQGANRFQRANYFFNTAKSLAQNNNVSFNWQLKVNQGLDHSYRPAVEKAADYLFK